MSLFSDVVGHERVIELLTAESARPAQAYLFVGPAGVDKATVARRFAALLIGATSEDRRRVLAAAHPDLNLVEPDGRAALSVDLARATAARANLAPVEAERKVYLFEEAGMMNDQAANALLKTLEEPTASTVFLLVTEAEEDLPITVASRCCTVRFGRVPVAEVEAALAARGLEEGQAAEVARISGGRPGLALTLATRPEVAHFRSVWLGLPARLTPRPGDAFRLAAEAADAAEPLLGAVRDQEDGDKERRERELRRASSALHVTGLEILASWYRDAAAAQFGAPARNSDVPPAAFTSVTPAVAIRCAERVLATIALLESHQRPELAFANLFAELGSAAS